MIEILVIISVAETSQKQTTNINRCAYKHIGCPSLPVISHAQMLNCFKGVDTFLFTFVNFHHLQESDAETGESKQCHQYLNVSIEHGTNRIVDWGRAKLN